jgi:cell division protein FtsZ
VIWGARIRRDFKGKVRLMAIISGVSSAQVLGPSRDGIAKENVARIDVIR